MTWVWFCCYCDPWHTTGIKFLVIRAVISLLENFCQYLLQLQLQVFSLCLCLRQGLFPISCPSPSNGLLWLFNQCLPAWLFKLVIMVFSVVQVQPQPSVSTVSLSPGGRTSKWFFPSVCRRQLTTEPRGLPALPGGTEEYLLSPGAIGLYIQPKSDRVPCISPQWLKAFVAWRRSGAESLALMEDISLSRVFSIRKVFSYLFTFPKSSCIWWGSWRRACEQVQISLCGSLGFCTLTQHCTWLSAIC